MRRGLLLLAAATVSGCAAEEEAPSGDCFVAGEAGGWLDSSAASTALKKTLTTLKQKSCSIERRSFESMDANEFRKKYLDTQPVILYHYSKQRGAAAKSDSSFQKSFDADQVKAWLTELGLSALAEEVAKESVDGYVAQEMDASDWAELGASSGDVATIAKAMQGSASVWSRDGLRYHCGSWATSLRTVAQILTRNESTAPETTLSDYIDGVRDGEEKGAVNGGIENPPSDPLGIKAQRGILPDSNFFLTGGELFEECEKAAAEATPRDLKEAISWASEGKKQKDDWLGHPQFSFGGSGTGMAFHQHGAELELLMTGTRRVWLSPGTAGGTPPGGYRPDKSQLKWVQESATKLPDSFYDQWKGASHCTLEAGELLYIPDAYYRASLNVGETLTVGAVASTDDWTEFFAEKDRIVAEAEKYLAPKHVDKEGHFIDGQDLGLSQKEIDEMIVAFNKKHDTPDIELTMYQARMHVREDGKTKAEDVEAAFHNALGADPLSMEMNLEYGKWLVKQNQRWRDGIQQWQRVIEMEPPTVEPYVFYAKLMSRLGKGDDLGLSPTGLRLVSDAMIAGAQRCQIVEQFKTEVMTKNSHDARLLLGQNMANAGFLLRSFPLQGEKPTATQKGLYEYAQLCDESNIVLSVTEDDAKKSDAGKAKMIKDAIAEVEKLFQVTKKPLNFDMGAGGEGVATASASDSDADPAAAADLAAGLEVPGETESGGEPKKKKKKKKKKKPE